MQNKFTGHKDADKYFLVSIDNEKDFLSICSTNTYFKKLCEGEDVYRLRLEKYYPDILNSKPFFKKYSEWYLKNMKAIGILKEKYDFIYKTGVPVIYLDIFDKHFTFGGVHLFIEAAGKYNYRDIIEYIERKRHGDVQDINMGEVFTTYFSNFLSLEELKSLVERIIDPNDENYTVMVVQPITMLTNKNYENFKYLLDKYSYTIPVDEEDAKEELYSYLWSIAKGKNEKIIDYALEYFIKSEGDKYLNIYLQAVIRALVRKKAPYEMINKYYEKFVIRTETDVFRIMQATYKNFDFFKRAIDNYMQNYRYIKVSPGIMEEVLHDCIVNKYYDSAKYLIQLGVKPIVDINNIRKLKNAEKTH